MARTTSNVLLEELRSPVPSQTHWSLLVSLYTPFIKQWLNRYVPGLGADGDDLIQEVMIVVYRKLPEFRRQRKGSFRTFLRGIVWNKTREYSQQRAKDQALKYVADNGVLDQHAGPTDEQDRWNQEHDRYVLEKALATIQADYEPRTLEAFRLFALEDRPAEEVAQRLGMTPEAVRLIGRRVKKRLKEEFGEFLDWREDS